jgi:hypothetical protein
MQGATLLKSTVIEYCSQSYDVSNQIEFSLAGMMLISQVCVYVQWSN